MKSPWFSALIGACLFFMVVPNGVFAQDSRSLGEPERTSKPSKQPNPLENVYFGEQQRHTRNS